MLNLKILMKINKNEMKKNKKSYFNEFKEIYYKIKNNPKKILLILLIDIIFLILIRFISTFFTNASVGLDTPSITIPLSILNFLLIVIIYSSSKLMILDKIKLIFNKEASKNIFSIRFIFLNLIIISISALIILFISYFILPSVKPEYMNVTFLITILPVLYIASVMIQISHSNFSEKIKLKKLLISSLKSTIKIKKYCKIILFIVISILLYFLIIIFLDRIFSIEILKNLFQSQSGFNIGNWIYYILTTLYFYLMLIFTRFYFFINYNERLPQPHRNRRFLGHR